MLGLRGVAAVAATAAMVLAAAGTAPAAPTTTVERTIADCDGDRLLERAPGEPHVFWGEDVPEAGPCESAAGGGRERLPRPRSVVHALQLTDFQVVDEESPARVEFLDSSQRAPGLNPFSAAYRPQEALTVQTMEAMVRQARNTTSPVTGARLDLTVLTGDNADSQQYNETRWFIDVLDGTTGEGDPDPEMHLGHPQPVIVPDSGLEGLVAACAPSDMPYTGGGSTYDGVRGGGRPGQDTGYYEPDGEGDGDGYTPDRTRNAAEVPGPHADVVVRDFPGLFEAAQEPFEAVGLGMPWYSAFGNHDALVQGNSPDAFLGPFGPSTEEVDPALDAVARGCLKASAPAEPPPYDEGDYRLDGTQPVVVPPDPRRCFLAKSEPNTAGDPCDTGGWIEQHRRTTGVPVGHGFDAFAVAGQSGGGRPESAVVNHDGYYAFSPRPGVRFVVLDSVTDECGAPVCAEGSIDDLQYRWLERELEAADDAGAVVLAFSHHTLRTIRMETTDVTEEPLHHGERKDPETLALVRPDAVETLEDAFCAHPSLIAHVNGHEHENRVVEHPCDELGQGPGRFWEVTTAAHIDWPQQSRLVELVDAGGELALVLTIVDHAGPARPGTSTAGAQPQRLAGIARELAFNDYQASSAARGDREDRNVIIPTGRPAPR